MGSENSEAVMALLQELSVLKELDRQFEANPKEGEQEAYRLRHARQEEITQEIRWIAEQGKRPLPEM
jgi:hypothetical protein